MRAARRGLGPRRILGRISSAPLASFLLRLVFVSPFPAGGFRPAPFVLPGYLIFYVFLHSSFLALFLGALVSCLTFPRPTFLRGKRGKTTTFSSLSQSGLNPRIPWGSMGWPTWQLCRCRFLEDYSAPRLSFFFHIVWSYHDCRAQQPPSVQVNHNPPVSSWQLEPASGMLPRAHVVHGPTVTDVMVSIPLIVGVWTLPMGALQNALFFPALQLQHCSPLGCPCWFIAGVLKVPARLHGFLCNQQGFFSQIFCFDPSSISHWTVQSKNLLGFFLSQPFPLGEAEQALHFLGGDSSEGAHPPLRPLWAETAQQAYHA